MSDQKAWTPDQPLRADATNEQIAQRGDHLGRLAMAQHEPSDPATLRILGQVAREYAAACVAALPVPPAGTREAVASIIDALDRLFLAVRGQEEQLREKAGNTATYALVYITADENGPSLNINAEWLHNAAATLRRAALPVPREGEAGTPKVAQEDIAYFENLLDANEGGEQTPLWLAIHRSALACLTFCASLTASED